MRQILIPLLLLSSFAFPVCAFGTTPADSAAAAPVAGFATPADSAIAQPKRSFVRKVYDYFADSRTNTERKRVDFGVLPGPHFSSTAGLGLGVVATATYTTDMADTTLTRSNSALYGDMTTKGFFLVGIKGSHIFPKEKYMLDYRLNVSTFSTRFWGLGYDAGNNDDNETDYRRDRIQALARFMVRCGNNLYVGPLAEYRFMRARDVDPEGVALFEGQRMTTNSQTVGVSLTYDSRDFMLNATRGWFVQLDQTFTPRFLGNNFCYSATELTVSKYGKLWKGAVLAGEYHSRFTYGNPAWSMMSEVGSAYRMRGYYEGRYRDKNIVEAQLELRQHIYGRSGAVAWVGAAQIFSDMDEMRWRKVLPSAGVGYRWEFKRGINVRFDLGFTKNGTGFLFNINEAF